MRENNKVIQLLGIFFLISSLYEGIDGIQALIVNSGLELYHSNIYIPYICTLALELIVGLLLVFKPEIITIRIAGERTNTGETIPKFRIAWVVVGIVLVVDSLPTLTIQSIHYFPMNSKADDDFFIVGLPLSTIIKEAVKLVVGIGFLVFYRMNLLTSGVSEPTNNKPE